MQQHEPKINKQFVSGCDVHTQSCDGSVSKHYGDETWRSKLMMKTCYACVLVYVGIDIETCTSIERTLLLLLFN